jgi:hypothetical protein
MLSAADSAATPKSKKPGKRRGLIRAAQRSAAGGFSHQKNTAVTSPEISQRGSRPQPKEHMKLNNLHPPFQRRIDQNRRGVRRFEQIVTHLLG